MAIKIRPAGEPWIVVTTPMVTNGTLARVAARMEGPVGVRSTAGSVVLVSLRILG